MEKHISLEEVHNAKLSLFLDEKKNPRLSIPLGEFEKLLRLSGNRPSILTDPINNAGIFNVEMRHVGMLSESNGERSVMIPDMGGGLALIYEVDFTSGSLNFMMGLRPASASGCE